MTMSADPRPTNGRPSSSVCGHRRRSASAAASAVRSVSAATATATATSVLLFSLFLPLYPVLSSASSAGWRLLRPPPLLVEEPRFGLASPRRRSAESYAASAALGVPRGGGGGDARGGGRGRRGGGLFGLGRRRRRNGRKKSGDGGDGDGGGGGGGGTLYPPLSRSEIEEKLAIPAYCVTDAEGTGIAVMGDTSSGGGAGLNGGNGPGGYVYLFLSKAMADEALRMARKANGHLEGLKVTALNLGKVWFRLLHNDDDVSVTMKDADSTGPFPAEFTRKVKFRLVPGARDLIGARVLLGLRPDDAEALRTALEPSPLSPSFSDGGGGGEFGPSDAEGARAIIERAAQRSPAFRTPFDEVPVFLMPRMRVRRQMLQQQGDGGGGRGGELSAEDMAAAAAAMEAAPPQLPLFLSSRNMVKTFLEMARNDPEILRRAFTEGDDGGDGEGADGQEQQPVVQLVELNRIVEMMQHESEMDFRNVVILPEDEEDENNNAGRSGEEDDDESDDDDEGGGGDFGLKTPAYDEAEFAPFVSMEVSVLGEGPGEERMVPLQ